MYRTHLFGVVPVIQQFHKILHIVFLIYCPSCLGSWRRQNYFGSLFPAFKNAKQQFNPQQVESSRKIASVRIYVEQAIKRVKAYCALDNLSISELKVLTRLVKRTEPTACWRIGSYAPDRIHLFGVVPVIQQPHIVHIVFLIYRPSCLDPWRRQNYFGSLLQS
jgi:hypothetical protein